MYRCPENLEIEYQEFTMRPVSNAMDRPILLVFQLVMWVPREWSTTKIVSN